MMLDPRNLPRSYPEMLQDLIAMHEKMKLYDSTEAKLMVAMLETPVLIAQGQLDRLGRAAAKRMINPT